jgi:3-oxoacyl-[acyl-carrier-protein] synthase II
MVKPYSKKIAVATTCTAVSNISRTWPECWQALLNGDSIFEDGSTVANRWPKTAPVSILCERAGWKEQPEFLHRFRYMSDMIMDDMLGILDTLSDPKRGLRVRIIIGTCHADPGALTTMVDYTNGVTTEMTAETLAMIYKTNITDYVEDKLNGRHFPISVVSSACASALVATSYASDMIDADFCDVVLVIAIDAITRVATAGFQNIKAMAKDCCRPYDANRSGTTVGEGAVSFVLARADCLPPDQIYGHIGGTSIFCDAAHLVEPNVEGIRTVLSEAMEQAQVSADQVAGIYWHGTGTKQNDKVESEVATLMFGAMSPPCTSTKGSLGHTMGASGGYNILAACESNRSGLMPQVATLEELEYANLDVVQGKPRKVKPGPMLISALGFGGIDAAVVVTP